MPDWGACDGNIDGDVWLDGECENLSKWTLSARPL